MVASELAFWIPAIQASWAASWALEPAPAISPERSVGTLLALLLLSELVSSLLPQAATPNGEQRDCRDGCEELA